MSSKKWLVVGISGATCSGKTTLATELRKELKDSVLISQDDYFLPVDDSRHTKIPELNHLNWEIITSLDMARMQLDISKLVASTPIKENTRETTVKRVLLLDGFLLFKSKFLLNLCDLKYFLRLSKKECWERRKERTYNPPDVPGYFEKVVWPEYVKHESELMNDKCLYKTVTFIDESKNKEDLFQMVLAEIKRLLS